MVSLLLFSLVLFIFSTPFSSCAPQGSEGPLSKRQIWRKTARLYIDKSCSQNQKKNIAQLKWDASNVFDAQKNWAPTRAFQPAMNLYLGTDSSNDKGGWFSSSYLSLIKGNYQRIRLGLLGKGSVKNYDYWWYCPTGNERWSKDICSKAPTGTSWNVYWYNGLGPPAYFWTALCPEFWQMPTLANVVSNVNARKAVKTDMNSYFPTQDLYFMEAFFELSPVVSDPAATPGPITPSEAITLARGKNTAGAYTSSFNYIYAAIAIYIQFIFDLPAPPSPKSPNVVLPASVPNITPIYNATSVTPPSPPNPSIWVSPTPVSDTPLGSAVALYQSMLSVSAAAAVPAPKPTAKKPDLPERPPPGIE